MPGMGTQLQTKNPVVVSAFHTALIHQVLFLGLVLVGLALLWNVMQTVRDRHPATDQPAPGASAAQGGEPEPVARKVARIGFGLLWVLDGLLQLQSAMPLGMPSGVLQPAASSSPGWVQSLVQFGVTLWTNHPVQAAAATVWIQLGIGLWLLVAPRGWWSRLGGLAAVGWGLVVWAFGEAFGGMFGSGVSWLFGAPGAVLFYCLAGALVALPERAWSRPVLGRALLRVMGVFFLAMAVVQAWPGRGSWQGAVPRSNPGSLVTMVSQMAQTPQPGFLASTLRAFGRVDDAHGWAVNLVVVVVLAAIGAALCTARVRVVKPAVMAGAVLCLTTWVLVQDLGFLGGVGTDPNSMVPIVIMLFTGYLALAGAPVHDVVADNSHASADVAAVTGEPATPDARRRWESLPPRRLAQLLGTVGAIAVVLVGVVPMASASTNPNADPILAEAVDGTPNFVDIPAPGFTLVDQAGRLVSLRDLRGKTVALTFLDPVCTSDCPVIAKEFQEANTMLGPDSTRVVFVAVVANPIYRSTAFTNAFDRQEGLEHMSNWLYLTGTVPVLNRVWDDYGVVAEVTPAGSMVAHSEVAYLIGPRGNTREILSADPGNGPSSSSSFSQYLADALEQVVHS